MIGSLDPLDLELVYGVAVGLVGGSDPELAKRHTLLSAIGACGARWARIYRRSRGSEFRLDGVRGTIEAAEHRLNLPERLERMLLQQGFLVLGRFPRLRRLLRTPAGMEEASLLVGCIDSGRLVGLLMLGTRVFGDDYTARDGHVVAEIGTLAARALYSAAGATLAPSDPGSRRHPRSTSPADDLRRRHPALRSIIGVSPAIVAVMEDVLALSAYDHPVLIHGETGVGKDLVARAIHEQSPRRSARLETVNCVALPEGLVESVLFGHEKGSFTGAVHAQKGHLELAGRGSLFLDEIGDLPLPQQAKLLLVLEQGEFRPVGAEASRRLDARILAATHRNLVDEVRAGRFREDLFYRIYGFLIHVPPLRERKDDLPSLVSHFIEINRAPGQSIKASDAYLNELRRENFHGNVRQLRWAIIRSMVRCGRGSRLLPEHLDGDLARLSILHATPVRDPADALAIVAAPGAAPVPRLAAETAGSSAAATSPVTLPTYEAMRRAYLMDVLRLKRGVVSDAARVMEEPRTSVHALIRRLGLTAFARQCRERKRP